MEENCCEIDKKANKNKILNLFDQLSTLSFLGYALITPCVIFVSIYCNILGIPMLPPIKDSVSFVGRTMLATTSNIFGATVVIAIFLIVIDSLIRKFTRQKFDFRWMRISTVIVRKNRVKTNYFIMLMLVLLLGAINLEIIKEMTKAIISIFLLASLILFPVVTALQVTYLANAWGDLSEKNRRIYTLNFVGLIVFFIVILTIVSEGFVKDYLVFPQVESKRVRIWIDDKVEYSMSCDKDIGSVFINKSPLIIEENQKSQKENYEKQINVINTDIASSICERVFNKRL